MTAPTATRIRERIARSDRLSSPLLKRTEKGIDHQVELDDLARQNRDEAAQVDRDIATDAADDRRRFVKYSAIEKALRGGDVPTALAAFHSLVAHVEDDEFHEDARRLGTKRARLIHAERLETLRRIFRDELMPIIGGRA